MHFHLSVLSSICLRTNKGLSMGSLKVLKVYIILGSFLLHFRENYVLYVIIYTIFPILCFGMVLLCVL